MLHSITFKNSFIAQDVVLMIANEFVAKLFVVEIIVEDSSHKIFFIVKDVTEYTLYDDHYQAYLLNRSYSSDCTTWRCLAYDDMKFCDVSFITHSSNDNYFVPKRWP